MLKHTVTIGTVHLVMFTLAVFLGGLTVGVAKAISSPICNQTSE